MSELVLAFAGTGKTTLAAKRPDDVFDMQIGSYKFLHPLDSLNAAESEHAKGAPSEVQPEWPWNYIEALYAEMKRDRYRYILTPTITWAAFAFERGLAEMPSTPYTLVYPSLECKDEYQERYIRRGNSDRFLDIFVNGGQWEGWISDFEHLNPARRIILKPGQYLQDVLRLD